MPSFEDPGQDYFRGLPLRNLKIDQAYLNVTSGFSSPVWLYLLSEDCEKCMLHLAGNVSVGGSLTHTLDTKRGWTVRMRSAGDEEAAAENDSAKLCDVTGNFGEFGVYDLRVTPATAGAHCELTTAKEPVDVYMSILVCFAFYVLLAIVWTTLKHLHRKGVFARVQRGISGRKQDVTINMAEVETRKAAATVKKRITSLDAFRGISIVIMIFVNDGGGQYWFFSHATWNGLLLADLVFPWFMWIMGVCIPIGMVSQLKRKIPKLQIFKHIVKRSCILFSLGIILNTLGGWINVGKLRIPGVLQRFGISYFVVASVAMIFTNPQFEKHENKLRAALQDVSVLLPQWVVMLCVMIGHCLITFLLPVPGCPTGYLGPGGRHDGGKFSECIGGAAGYIDRWLLNGTSHIYNWPTARHVYGAGPFDPEGVLGSLLCIFQVFLGVQAGMTLLVFSEWKQRVLRWIVWAGITGVIGTILCVGTQNDGWIPVNKNLWSLSFVMVTTCFSFLLLALCYLLIDVKDWWNGAPFLYPGMNAILMYVGHQITYNLFPWHYVHGAMNTHWEKLVEALWGTTLWVLIAFVLFQKKIFLAI